MSSVDMESVIFKSLARSFLYLNQDNRSITDKCIETLRDPVRDAVRQMNLDQYSYTSQQPQHGRSLSCLPTMGDRFNAVFLNYQMNHEGGTRFVMPESFWEQLCHDIATIHSKKRLYKTEKATRHLIRRSCRYMLIDSKMSKRLPPRGDRQGSRRQTKTIVKF